MLNSERSADFEDFCKH